MALNEPITELRVQRAVDVPLHEVSGICLMRCREHEGFLLAVGDRSAKVASLLLSRENIESPEWQKFDLSDFDGPQLDEDDSQIEAICGDGAGRVLLMRESPPRAGLFDLEASRALSAIELVVEGADEIAKSWADPDGSRGEGAVLLPSGHLLVAKEKGPAALIEFGPKGSTPRGFSRGGGLQDGERWPLPQGERLRFVALARWVPDKDLRSVCGDFSDMEIGPDGRLYLLSDQSATIARIDCLEVDDPVARPGASWSVGELKGKPEGLAFTPDGRAIVALDKRKKERNLVLLEPPIAPPNS